MEERRRGVTTQAISSDIFDACQYLAKNIVNFMVNKDVQKLLKPSPESLSCRGKYPLLFSDPQGIPSIYFLPFMTSAILPFSPMIDAGCSK